MPRVRHSIVAPDRDYYYNGQNRNIKFTYDRRSATNTTSIAALTSGVMRSVAFFGEAGQVVTNISYRSGGVAAVTPTNWWFALYDTQAVPALLSQTADQTTTAWGASTVKTLALSTNGGAQTLPVTGVYYIALCMAAATVVTLTGIGIGAAYASSGMAGSMPTITQTSGSGLTTTAPPTIASPTADGNMVFGQTS